MAPGTDDFDTSVSCDNRHKDCCGVASNCFPIPSNISSEKHVVFTVTSHTAQLLYGNLYTILRIVDFR